MNKQQLLENYAELNNSFKEKITFHLGAEAGFFSEFNNMVLAMLYCLSKEIKFTLYSKKANFALEKGWNDFFESFCEETDFFLHSRYNRRAYQIKNQRKLPPKVLKLLTGNEYLTQDIWDSFRSEEFSQKKFNIPQLGLNNSSLLEATQKIIHMIWNYNANSQKIIEDHVNMLNLPGNYISVHIRAGDKTLEANTFDFHHYMKKAQKVGHTKKAFILTDNYTVFEDLKRYYSNWEFFTLCSSSERGYVHSEFRKRDKNEKYLQHLKLFASLDVCAASEKFIGTYSSNPGMFMGMRIGEDKCACVDYDAWKLW